MVLSINNLFPDQTGFPAFLGGGPRFLASQTSDDIEVFPGNLVSYAGGVWGLGGNDTIAGSSDSNERLFGNDGEDVMGGAEGNDILYGGKGSDRLDGNEGNDLVRGDAEDDFLFGGPGNDLVRGGQGNDQLVGDDGNDFLIGDRGFDILVGNQGADTFVFRTDEATFNVTQADVIGDFNFREGDRIGLTDGLTEVNLNFSDDNLLDYDGDGSNDDLAIRLQTTGQILGVVLNVDNFDLIGQFESASPFALGLNGTQFAYLP